MARDELLRFTQAAKARGLSDETIAGMLKASGWSEDDTYAAIRQHYELADGLETPVRRGISEGARDAFVYLLSFGTLGTWTVAAGALLFSAMEHTWPDPVMTSGYPNRYANAHNLASVLVAFPVYLLATRVAVRDVRADPDRRESPIRRWLTWLALLIAAGVVLGDVITFLAYLLRGDITVRFILKVLTVLVLAGGVFWYYLASLTREVNHRAFAIAASCAVAASVIAGFGIMGPPAYQRGIEADRRRVEQLAAIASEISMRGAPLPDSLSALRTPVSDPVTGQPFEYRRLGESKYELCAVFAASSEQQGRRLPVSFWTHGPGRTCFVLDAERGAGKW